MDGWNYMMIPTEDHSHCHVFINGICKERMYFYLKKKETMV